jgi:protein-S-isoprenylcysteine O-methyltransferase Ste14
MKSSVRTILKPSVWAFYAIFVLEILFMISPFALYFYALYGPVLDFFQRWAVTAWLTQFFLPHFSTTSSLLLNNLRGLAGVLIVAGIALFLAGALPLYWAKLRHRGVVTGGLYAVIRHPQYGGLALLGLGTLLLWPRFLALITYVIMLFLYAALARWEEERCLAQFGDSYQQYQARTGRFLPPAFSLGLPRLLPAAGGKRVLATWGLCAVVIAGTVWLGFRLRDYALTRISAVYTTNAAVLSPAVLSANELRAAYRTAAADPRVQEELQTAAPPATLIVYVVPREWYLADLPLEVVPPHAPGHGHYTPAHFDRRYYKVLFTRARTHAPTASGEAIIKCAYGRDPLVRVHVDITSGKVVEIATPPPHVYWGDIPTPMF